MATLLGFDFHSNVVPFWGTTASESRCLSLSLSCSGQVGAVVSIEASRLHATGRDWHTLLEFCALVGSVIVDEDGVYDPRSVNDRLLLGMKGTLSEMELSLLR